VSVSEICIERGVNAWISKTCENYAFNFTLSDYTVRLSGFINTIGKLSLKYIVKIPAWGKNYAAIPIIVDRYVIEKLIREFGEYSTGRKVTYVIPKLPNKIEITWDGKKLVIDLSLMPKELACAWILTQHGGVGYVFAHVLPSGEAMYFHFPSKALLEAKLPKFLELPEYPTPVDMFNISLALFYMIVRDCCICKCIICEIERRRRELTPEEQSEVESICRDRVSNAVLELLKHRHMLL